LKSSAARSCAVLVGAGAAYLVLAIVHTYPLIVRLGSHLPGHDLGDNVSFVWNLWWMREALASPDQRFFTCPAMFAPLGGSLVLHTHTALSASIAATLLSRFSVVEAQNILIIGSLALNCLAVFCLTRMVSGSGATSFVAGALFVVAPAITARLMGHFNLVVAWPLIFGCAAFIRWWRAPTWPNTAALVLCAVMTLYADYYYTVFLALFAIAYTVSDLWHPRWQAARRSSTALSTLCFAAAAVTFAAAVAIGVSRRSHIAIGPLHLSIRTSTNALTTGWLLVLAGVVTRWRFRAPGDWRWHAASNAVVRRTIVAALLLLALASPLVLAASRAWLGGDYVTQTSSLKSSPAGVDVATVVLGPPFSMGGARVRRLYQRLHIDAMESSAWIGLVPALLLLIAIRQARFDRELRRWIIIAAVFAVWALGPYLRLLGENSGLLLPQAIGRFVPILNNARIPGRAMMMVDMSIAVVASVLLARIAKPRLSLVALCLVTIAGLAESLAMPLPLVQLPDAGVYDAIARDRSNGTVLSIPFGVRDGFSNAGQLEHDALLAQTRHHHPIAGGFLARVPERVSTWYQSREPYSTLLRLSHGGSADWWPSCESMVDGLSAASVSYVVLYRDDATPALRAFVDAMPLTQTSADNARTLFRVAPGACHPGH
jgi:hypothetical protein